MGPESQKERVPDFRREGSITLVFPDSDRLSAFTRYATDFRNAKVIFRSAFYRIDSLGDGIEDPNLLRKVGARFSFRGRLVIPIKAPLKVDLQVTEYDLFRVGIASQQVQVLGVNMPIKLLAGWHFGYSVNGNKKPEATLTAGCHVSPLLVQALGLFFAWSFPQRLIDEEMKKIGQSIASDFKRKGDK